MGKKEKDLEQRLSKLADMFERVEKLLLKETTSVEDLQNELRRRENMVIWSGTYWRI
ncbi:MAG: hypothetical protein HYU02_03880 [Thaumarchaeota archaeon]|nr:hypothetical protein [Nitrososphaerota archaeon]